MGRLRELFLGLALGVFGLIFAFVTVEAGVRFLHLEPDRFWEADPLLGSRHIPGKSGWWTQEDHEFLVPIHINEDGWRGPRRTREKPAGTFRVLVLGDSFSEGFQVPLADSFPRVLEGELQKRLPSVPVQVINTGVSGYGTAGELLLFERDGKQYQPDLVLLAFYPGNDVMNNSPQLEDTLVPTYDGGGTPKKVKWAGKHKAARGLRGLLAQSAAYRYGRRILLNGHPQLAQRLAHWGLLKPQAIHRQPALDGMPRSYQVYGAPDAAWDAAWEHTSRLLDDLAAATRRAGARLAVAIVSSRDELYPEDWQSILDTYPQMKGREWHLDGPRHRVEALCRSKGIPVLDLTPAMQGAVRDGQAIHFHHDGHWTPAGQRLAGENMAAFLVQQKLIPSAMEVPNEVR